MSTSASRNAWAIASEPVSSSSSSPSNFGGGTVVVGSGLTAMTIVTPYSLPHGLLMHCSRLFRLFDELGVKRNAVLLQELVVLLTVLLIQRVQIVVVVELQLVRSEEHTSELQSQF